MIEIKSARFIRGVVGPMIFWKRHSANCFYRRSNGQVQRHQFFDSSKDLPSPALFGKNPADKFVLINESVYLIDCPAMDFSRFSRRTGKAQKLIFGIYLSQTINKRKVGIIDANVGLTRDLNTLKYLREKKKYCNRGEQDRQNEKSQHQKELQKKKLRGNVKIIPYSAKRRSVSSY